MTDPRREPGLACERAANDTGRALICVGIGRAIGAVFRNESAPSPFRN